MDKILFMVIFLVSTAASSKTVNWKDIKKAEDLKNVDAIRFTEKCRYSDVPFGNSELKIEPIGKPEKADSNNYQKYRGLLNHIQYKWVIAVPKEKKFSHDLASSKDVFTSYCEKITTTQISSQDCSRSGHNTNP